MPYTVRMRTSWNDREIERRLMPHVENLSRMPSANELRACGENDLACAISRRGGFRNWAQRLAQQQKGSETHRAQRWERWAADVIRKNTNLVVLHRTTRAPFDILINGRLRVDVKASLPHDYGSVRGHIFAGCKYGASCDAFLFLCLAEDGESVDHFYYVPANMVKSQTVTITARKAEAWQYMRGHFNHLMLDAIGEFDDK